jgi:hypothetical protein
MRCSLAHAIFAGVFCLFQATQSPMSSSGSIPELEVLLHLTTEKKVGAPTRKMHVAAIKFLYERIRRPVGQRQGTASTSSDLAE